MVGSGRLCAAQPVVGAAAACIESGERGREEEEGEGLAGNHLPVGVRDTIRESLAAWNNRE